MTVIDLDATPTTAALRRIADDVRVLDERTFTTAGRLVRRDDNDPLPAERWLRHAVHQHLYQHHYLGGAATAANGRPASALEDADLGRRLRAANACTGHLDPGWTVTAVTGCGHLELDKGGLRLHATADEVSPPGASVGQPVVLRLPADRPYASPGFYLTVGSAGPPPTASPITRWYFNIGADGAVPLLHAVTTTVDGAAVPFTFKVLNHPAAYGRPDAGVLYLGRGDAARLAPQLVAIRQRLSSWFGHAVPLFTRAVAPGLAIADEPPPGPVRVSFGQHRCAIVGDAIIAAGPDSTPADRFQAVIDAFTAAGFDPLALHLNPGSDDLEVEVTPC